MKITIAFFVSVIMLLPSLFVSTDAEISGVINGSAVMAPPEPLPPQASEENSPAEGEIDVLVLGDSIARGYGLSDVENERFSAVLTDKLGKKFTEVNVSNYGVDGITGADLVNMLKNNPPEELYNADYVLISIGGNNVLRSIGSLDGLNQLSANVNTKVFFDYFRYLFAKNEEEKKSLDYARKTIDVLFKTANDAFGGDEFNSIIKTASENLKNEIPIITELIKGSNPNAKIIIQTVYNPYKDINISLKSLKNPLNLSAFGEKAVLPLNENIEEMATVCGYSVAPVFDGFEASSNQLTNAGFDLLNAVFGLDPHPNKEGHVLIADIYYKLITEE